jgi:S1/P1 Nuclease
VDEIDQFAAELGSPETGASEQLLALKFLLHFVGDLHQSLHAGDDHDPGGIKKPVTDEWLTPATFIAIRTSTLWSVWALTRVE